MAPTNISTLLEAAQWDLSETLLLREAAHRAKRWPWPMSIEEHYRVLSKYAAKSAKHLIWG